MEGSAGPDPRRRDLAYQLLNGFVEIEIEGMRPLSKRAEIDLLTAKIYQHRIKLCARADLDFEDEDMEGIVSTYEQLNRLCADAMYDQGWHDADRNL